MPIIHNAFENQIFDHYRKMEKEKNEWIKKLKSEGYVVYEKGKKNKEDKVKA
jgi:hypothetical protein|tara:strand:- start:14405 stop:14560 length:156 start_codon:yes stop_codon:yes gene_type:complete